MSADLNSSPEIDVIIIGAGLSGLQAARSLQDAGLKTLVLEARSRVGGMTWSVASKDGSGVSDLGAEWLNDTTQPHVYQLALKLGLEVSEVKVSGDAIFQGLDNGTVRHAYGEQAPGRLSQLPGGEHEIVNQMRELFEAEYSKVDLESLNTCGNDDVTLQDFVLSRGGGSATLGTVAVWTRVMLGCEPSDLSAAYFFVYCKSQGGLMKMRSGKVKGRYVTIKTGAQSIATRLAASLESESVKLSTAVNSITQISKGVEVRSTSGCVFKAKKAIVAFATPLYKNITFDPPLPAGKAHLAESTILGHYSKVMLVYSKPWWRERGLCGASQSLVGPAAATRDTSEDGLGLWRLTGFIAGGPGEQWSLLAPDERKAAVIAQIFKVFGQEDTLHPTDYVEQQWASEQWSLGCPCPYTQPGVLTSVGQHITDFHGHVHFVGAETAVQWKGYMEGALTSGMRGASEVIKALEKRE